MSPLTKVATNRVEYGCKKITRQNYLIGAVCGLILGVMLGLGV